MLTMAKMRGEELMREAGQSRRAAGARRAARTRQAVPTAARRLVIRRLPEPQRVTLTMAAAGGMTSAELAAVLGVPAGTVRYRLARSAAERALFARIRSALDPDRHPQPPHPPPLTPSPE